MGLSPKNNSEPNSLYYKINKSRVKHGFFFPNELIKMESAYWKSKKMMGKMANRQHVRNLYREMKFHIPTPEHRQQQLDHEKEVALSNAVREAIEGKEYSSEDVEQIRQNLINAL